MKIFFDGIDFSSRTGPNVFARRLAKALHTRNHSIADEDDYDVHLAFIEPTRQTRPGKRLVQRLDGIWFKPEEFYHKNASIRVCYERADGVVWQSAFDKQMITKWWGLPKNEKCCVIHNGVDPRETDDAILRSNVDYSSLDRLREAHKTIFVASANWHPQKRLSSNIAAFKHLQQFYSDSCLIVLGANATMIADPHIFYAGSVEPEIFVPIYKAASWMIHLAWLDHCPNSVVEALVQGTPVICTNSGGTQEIVGDNGIILSEAEPGYNFELSNYDQPPAIDVTQLGKLPVIDVAAPELHIDVAAAAYEKFFEDIL